MGKGVLIGIVIAVFVIGIASFLFLTGGSVTQSPKPKREINIVGGELDIKGPYGFALKGENLSSPAPTLRLKIGEVVKVNFQVIGQVPHTFNIVSEAKEGADTVWGAAIGVAGAPINPGQSRSVEFAPQQEGEFFYVCLVPGHISAFKMIGKIVVER